MLQNDAGGESHGWGAIGQVYLGMQTDLGLAGKREGSGIHSAALFEGMLIRAFRIATGDPQQGGRNKCFSCWRLTLWLSPFACYRLG